MAAREVTVLADDGTVLAGEDTGVGAIHAAGRAEEEKKGEEEGGRSEESAAIVLLHGLTATRRYVVMGSRLLERSGYRVIAYDARGHGRSAPAGRAGVARSQALDWAGTGEGPRVEGEAAYGYERLARDLEAVLDALGILRAALAGASMGAHTALRFALSHPERVAALGLVTPAFDPAAGVAAAGGASRSDAVSRPTIVPPEGDRDVLARALREGGVEGFVRAYDFSTVPPAWRDTVERVVTQRLSLHEHPGAVADAMEVVSRSRPFESFAELAAIAAPTVVVASRDEVDPGHPLALAERYAQAIPGATFTVEDGGAPLRSPIAWQGGQLSKVLVELLERATGLAWRAPPA